MESVIKSSSEVIPHTIDWTNRIPSTDTISSASVTAINLKTQATDLTIFVSPTGTVSSFNTSFRLQAGSNGTDYKMIFTAITANHTYTQAQLLKVREEEI